ncbi:hypothetical protein O9993_07615 [Vibrio lentus]|nr:hypothetical protein [Vibrio lentus]
MAALLVPSSLPRYLSSFLSKQSLNVAELLKVRFGEKTKQRAGVMYLMAECLLQVLSRLYMAAICRLLILFTDIAPSSVVTSVIILVAVGLAYTYMGGIRSVIWVTEYNL